MLPGEIEGPSKIKEVKELREAIKLPLFYDPMLIEAAKMLSTESASEPGKQLRDTLMSVISNGPDFSETDLSNCIANVMVTGTDDIERNIESSGGTKARMDILLRPKNQVNNMDDERLEAKSLGND